jgi:hypothetical protein
MERQRALTNPDRRPEDHRMRLHHPRFLLAGFALLAAGAAPPAAHAAAVTVGAAITVEQATPIAAILAAPQEHAGQLVRVEGEVSGVCTKAGCWMDLADADGRRLRIKVEDGVLVFPPDAAGRPAVAQGTVDVKELSRDEYVAWHRHVAAEGGPAFDESKLGAGPYELVQIAGTGAAIGK